MMTIIHYPGVKIIKWWKYSLGIILILFAYALCAWLVFVFAEPSHNGYDHVNWPDKAWVIERHRYHGITVSIEENGKHYFYDRRGRRCKL